MSSALREQLPLSEIGEHTVDWGDFTVDWVSPPSGDLRPLLKGLPGDLCQCPHWGFLFKGRLIVRYADREEFVEAGQVFYMPPGHAPEALEECEILQFSPADKMRVTMAAMMANIRAMQQAQ